LTTTVACLYENQRYGFLCDELPIDTDSNFCIFHDANYLKGENYEKNKEEVYKRFEKKLAEYSSNNMAFKFIGYFLPDIWFYNKQLTSPIYFTDTTFYGEADFSSATFSGIASFKSATFSQPAKFSSAKFSG
jgi:hypothetical protein